MPRRHLFYGFIMWEASYLASELPINWESVQKPQEKLRTYICTAIRVYPLMGLCQMGLRRQRAREKERQINAVKQCMEL